MYSDVGEWVMSVTSEEHEQAVLSVIQERDIAQDAADRMAAALAPAHVVGEHSNTNDPWANALEWAEENPRSTQVAEAWNLGRESLLREPDEYVDDASRFASAEDNCAPSWRMSDSCALSVWRGLVIQHDERDGRAEDFETLAEANPRWSVNGEGDLESLEADAIAMLSAVAAARRSRDTGGHDE